MNHMSLFQIHIKKKRPTVRNEEMTEIITDIDECVSIDDNGNSLHSNATCTNTDGSFSSACDTGYDVTDIDVTDISIDDNGSSLHNCHSNDTSTTTSMSDTSMSSNDSDSSW